MSAAEISTAPQTQAFAADVSRLLHLMTHSVYSDRDIFVRELISNAADGCEKLRYEAIAHPEWAADGAPFAIQIAVDADGKRLTFSDNGIGMSRDEMVDALGTIARSGTRAFLDKLGSEEKEKSGSLIGQFGIGFYSAFMVADEVDVFSRRAGASEAWRWTSDGKGSFTIAAVTLDEAPEHGARVVLHLNPESEEYADSDKIERIVRQHSSAIAIPINIAGKPGEESKPLSEGAALWTKAKADITQDEYTDFYQTLSGQFDDPALTVHWRAEGRHEYSALAFVPGERPMDLFDPARKSRNKLYVRRVLIAENADLAPGWLRFVRFVVDSADLPLNVSREMIQQSAVFVAIKKGVTNRILQELTKLAEAEPEKFAKVWENFGAVLKEGLYEDPERRDAIYKIARFATTSAPEGGRTLDAYVKDLRENQTAIFYLTGDDSKRLAASPQLEGFKARGVEVLLLADPVDSFWIGSAAGFDGKPFKSVSQGAADIKAIPLLSGDKPAEEIDAATASLLAYLKQTLEGEVADARISDRLTDSAACLVAPDFAPDRHLERLLSAHGRVAERTKPILEVNPRHPIVLSLVRRLRDTADRSLLDDTAWLLVDEARLMEGDAPRDAVAFATRLSRVMQKALDAV